MFCRGTRTSLSIIQYFRVALIRVALVTLTALSCCVPVLQAQAAASKPAGAVETITGRAVASPHSTVKDKAKRAGKFKLKRQGEPWEVRIVSADGREQIYRGYRTRAAKRDARGSDRSSRGSGDPSSLRVMRLQLPASP